MAKPTILLIPGSFALPNFYDEVYEPIRAKGYDIRGLHKPSVGLSAGEPRPGPPPTMYDDAAYIAGEAEKLADEGKDVILVPHSYGGVPTSQSTKGLSKEERQKDGKKGGVVEIAYMTCLVPEVGRSAKDVLMMVPPENLIDLPVLETGWMLQNDHAASAKIAFSDLPPEEGAAWVAKFPQHSAISFVNELTHAGYKDVAVSYFLCERDRCITPDVQRAGIEMMEKASGRKVDVTSFQGDHCPMTLYPQDIANWILKVAEKY